MVMTLGEIRDYVRTHMDIEEEDLPDHVLDIFIREGSRKIEYSEQRWPYFEASATLTTTPGMLAVPKSSVASDIKEVASITLDGRNLSWRSMEELQTYGQSMGWPRLFSEWGDNFHLWPTPDAEYQLLVRYYRKMRDWVSEGAGAVPDLPEELHNTVAQWALHRAYAQQEDLEQAQVHRTIFDQELNEFGRRLTEMPLHRPLVMGGRGRTSRPRGRPRFDWE